MRKRHFVVRKKGAAIFRLWLLILVVLVLCGAVYGVITLARGASSQSLNMEALPFTADTNYTFTGTGFLYMYENRLYYDDLTDARQDASYQVSTGDVRLVASPTISVLYHDSAVQILGGGESLSFTDQVAEVACGVSHVAVLLLPSSGGASIHIYDTAGNQTDQMDFDAGELLDFGFADTSEDTFWTLEMTPMGTLPLSTLTTYNLATNHTTGVMSIQGQLVDQVVFTKDSVFLACTTNLIRYNRTGNTEAYRTLVYGWELGDVTTSGSSPLMLFKERGSSPTQGSIKLYTMPEGDVAAASASVMQLPEGTISAFLSGGKLYACTSTHLYSYSSTGRALGSYPLSRNADKALKLAEGYMLITSGNGLYVAPLP